MTITEMIAKLKLICKNSTQKFSYTYSSIDLAATDQQILSLGKALNSLQDTVASQIIRVKEVELLPA